MPVSILPSLVVLAAGCALASLVVIAVALIKHRSPMLWFALAGFVTCAGGAYASYSRLDRIHGELFRSEISAKTESELLARLGSPSRRESYLDHGNVIEVLFYDITFLRPPVHVQFQFHDGRWVGTFATNL